MSVRLFAAVDLSREASDQAAARRPPGAVTLFSSRMLPAGPEYAALAQAALRNG